MAYGDRSGPLGAAASTTIAATGWVDCPKTHAGTVPLPWQRLRSHPAQFRKSILESFLIHLNLLHTRWAFCT
jgi:hypothetical protein